MISAHDPELATGDRSTNPPPPPLGNFDGYKQPNAAQSKPQPSRAAPRLSGKRAKRDARYR